MNIANPSLDVLTHDNATIGFFSGAIWQEKKKKGSITSILRKTINKIIPDILLIKSFPTYTRTRIQRQLALPGL